MHVRVDGSRLSPVDRTFTLMLRCPICASDEADTLGVTGSDVGSPDATVIMRCEDCSAVYLSPRASGPDRSPLASVDTLFSRSRLRRWSRGLPASAKILCVTPADCIPESGGYDLILLSRSLESADDPSALLRQAAGLLAPGGRVVVIGGNAASSCFALFGGRHWNGYQFPQTRLQLTPAALRRASTNAGLRIIKIATESDAQAWLHSTANWLHDWDLSPALVHLLTGRWLLPQAVAALLEGLAAARGRAALLVAQLERP
ncbi:MAG: methyltransferase domain-containing protein [Steroidobacteraceae bacterium]